MAMIIASTLNEERKILENALRTQVRLLVLHYNCHFKPAHVFIIHLSTFAFRVKVAHHRGVSRWNSKMSWAIKSTI